MFEYRIFGPDNRPDALFRFRYEVYVEELGRKQAYACHDTRTIEDPLDASAHHCIVYRHDEIVACVRLNLVAEGDVEPYHSFYELGRIDPEISRHASICTRNMVARPFRKTGVAVRMLKQIYEFGMRRGATTCFMDVNAPLIGLFSRFGYKPLFEKTHPDYGDVTVMRLDVLDLEGLKAIRSPFAPICAEFLERKGVAAVPA